MIFAHGMYNVYKYRSHDRVNIYLLTYESTENYNSVQLEASRSNKSFLIFSSYKPTISKAF